MRGTPVLRGITWDHPRGYAGLFAATQDYLRQHPDVLIEWDRQPLAGFEATPIEGLAARYDLIILDHPFMGDALASGCMVDLDTHCALLDLDALRSDVIGPSFDIYRYGGLWALPIDASTQMSVFRPDRLAEAPGSIEDVRSVARAGGLAIALNGPHAFLTLLSIYSNLGDAPDGDARDLLDAERGLASVELLRAIRSMAVRDSVDWNSIGLLEALSTRDDLAYCPYVYGFSAYTRPARGRHLLRFTNVPELAPGSGCRGAMLGGTGLAISARCRALDEALRYAAYLTAPATQKRMAIEGGQPARLSVWLDAGLDGAFAGFYRGTQSTMERSAVRPRYPGYIRLQIEGGHMTERFLREGGRPRDLVDGLNALHRQLRFG